MMQLLAVTLLPALVAMGMVHWAFFKILRIAKDKNLVDNPDARKLQRTPIPVLGGIAVFLGFVFGILVGTVLIEMLGLPKTSNIFPPILAMVVMMYVGAMDDILGLSPRARLVIEILTVLGVIYSTDSCIDTFHGLFGVEYISWWIAVPLTVFAGVGIINAVNMIDGVNGLSSGMCIICCLLFGVAFVDIGDAGNALLAFSMVGGLFPFLMHNVFGQRSRMFIGDAGTMTMGMLMVWFTISVLDCHNEIEFYIGRPNIDMVSFALAVLAVPVFDTLRVMAMRMYHRRSPFSPDKTHLHHAFINVGISHSVTTLTEVSIGLMVCGIWNVSVLLHANAEAQLATVIVSSVVLVWGMYVVLRVNARHHTRLLHQLTKIGLRSRVSRRSWCIKLEHWLDAPEIRMLRNMGRDHEAHLDRRYGLRAPLTMEQNREKVVAYMRGKAEVFIVDIMRNSGADPAHVLEALAAEEHYDNVIVTKVDAEGKPEIVALKGENA